MIVEWALSLASGFVHWVAGLFGTADAPAFIGTIASFVTGLVNAAAGLGAWVPWAFIGITSGIMGLLWGTVFAIKAVRWLWGLTPFSGGS